VVPSSRSFPADAHAYPDTTASLRGPVPIANRRLSVRAAAPIERRRGRDDAATASAVISRSRCRRTNRRPTHGNSETSADSGGADGPFFAVCLAAGGLASCVLQNPWIPISEPRPAGAVAPDEATVAANGGMSTHTCFLRKHRTKPVLVLLAYVPTAINKSRLACSAECSGNSPFCRHRKSLRLRPAARYAVKAGGSARRRPATSDRGALSPRGDCIFAPTFETAVKRFQAASQLCQGAANRLPHRLRPIGGGQRPMPRGTDLDQATFIIDPELVTVDVAEVDLHSGQFTTKPLQKPIHFASDKLDHSRIYRYVFAAIDLYPHAYLCCRRLPRRSKTSQGLIQGCHRRFHLEGESRGVCLAEDAGSAPGPRSIVI